MIFDDGLQEVRSLRRSFDCALRGVAVCICGERNMRIHLVIATYVLAFSIFYQLSAAEYALLVLTVGMTLTTEALNTALEALINRDISHYSEIARVAKDISAGAVLISAFASVGVGLILLLRPAVIAALFVFLFHHYLYLAALLLSLPVAAAFIVGYPFKKGRRRSRDGR